MAKRHKDSTSFVIKAILENNYILYGILSLSMFIFFIFLYKYLKQNLSNQKYMLENKKLEYLSKYIFPSSVLSRFISQAKIKDNQFNSYVDSLIKYFMI